MKKLLIALLLMGLIFSVAEAQKVKLFKTWTWTLDSLTDSLYYDTTMVIPLPKAEEWPLGIAMLEVIWDSTAGGIADSSLFQVRPGSTAGAASATNVYTATDGSAVDWTPLKVYENLSTWANWTYAVPLTDGDRFMTSWEMGSVFWPCLLIQAGVYDSTASADGYGKWYFNLYLK